MVVPIEGGEGEISGSTTVEAGSTQTYWYNSGFYEPIHTWDASGGIVISTSQSGTTYYVTIQWGQGPMGTVFFGDFMAYLDVTITESVSMPPMPTITNNCGSTVLTRGTPPSGEIWYWQTSYYGTSTSNSGVSVAFTSSGVYYLRAYKLGSWSPARTINYTVTQPTNWYEDSDGDGFGDPYSQPEASCTPITGKVENNDDNCPDFYSTVNSGCEAGYVYENINWIISKVYDVRGNLKANSKSYYNELGKIDQVQKVDFKTIRTWASQTLYDWHGRPALQTLSAPINSTGYFLYKSDFITNSGGGAYTINDFENTPESPSPVGTGVNTLGWYYSSLNTDSFEEGNSYQDITSYPFTRTIYSKLNPGGVLKTIGGNKIDGEWKQSYSFTMPAGQELSRSVAFNSISYNSIKTSKTIVRDVHGTETVVFTDSDGNMLAAARSGGTATPRTSTIYINEQGYADVHIPSGTTGITVSNTSAVSIYDLITEQTVNTSAGSLPNGFYRVSVNNIDTYTANSISVTYKENYYDYSLNTYDRTGKLLSSKQPLDHLETIYEYNSLGQLLETTSPDEGMAEFKYRKDGQIRFSRNSEQSQVNEFSYTNYDDLGRPIESGVASTEIADDFLYLDPDGVFAYGFSASERHFTVYDEADITGLHAALTTEGIPTTYYADQQFLAGNVSKTYTQNPNTTTTWYNYDVYGRVMWMVQKIDGLGAKTIDYTYDPVTGNVIKVDYQKYKSSERFVHRYTYNDVDQLIQVETSKNGSTFINQAKYYYYETGALRRVEVADNLQGIDYVYNLTGQLKAINHPSGNNNDDPGKDGVSNGFTSDMFSMALDYYNGDYQRTTTPTPVHATSGGIDQYNGNIKAMSWKTNHQSMPDTQTYYYGYNKNNWLESASLNIPLGESGSGVDDFQQSWYWQDFLIGSPAGGGSNVTLTASNNTITFYYNAGFVNSYIKTGPVVQINYPVPDVDLGYIQVTRSTGEIYTDKFSVSIQSGWLVVTGEGAYPSYQYKGMKSLNNTVTVNAAPPISEGDYNVYDITYDANGNIKTLNRNKHTENGSNEMDKFTYNYYAGKNQLENVDDTATPAVPVDDLKDQTPANYQYNSIGQLVSNTKDNIEYVYNAAGLVTEVKRKTDGYPIVRFFYNDRGQRVHKMDMLNETHTYYVRDASGSVIAIYNNTTLTEHPIYGLNRLGVHYRVFNKDRYQLTDHLGNVRAVAERSNSTLLSATDYYPFGMPMPGRQVVGGELYRFGYQGEFAETDPETGKVAFELRLYDPRICKWLSTDPYREFHSPYLAMGNNPIRTVDPDGGKGDDDYKINEDGTFTLIKETETADRVFNDQGEFVQLEYDGQIKDMQTLSTPKGGKFNYIGFSNDKISTDAFQFFSKNSNVEWGQVLYDKNSSYVTTSNSALYVDSFDEALLSRGYNIRESIHSHPTHYIGSDFPSGFYEGVDGMTARPNQHQKGYGDKGHVERLYDEYGEKAIKIIFKVYSPKNDSYVQYNDKGAHKIIHIPKTIGVKF